jgi:hypothetical protein
VSAGWTAAWEALQAQLNDATAFLPPHDRRTAQGMIDSLDEQISE